jgi:hypothetical protein
MTTSPPSSQSDTPFKLRRILSPLVPVAMALLFALAALPCQALAQVSVRDLVITSGIFGERFQGNLPTVGTILQDSTEVAAAFQSETALRTDLLWRPNGTTQGLLSLDGGVRQFSAYGFEGRDYAPREWVGSADFLLLQPLPVAGAGIRALAGYRGRRVQDRAPMPLFLQPDQQLWYGGAGIQLPLPGRWDPVSLSITAEEARYRAPSEAPQIRLLNRETASMEARSARPVTPFLRVEAELGLDWSRYPEQSTLLPSDSIREDQTYRGRVGWVYQGEILARAGLEGRVNRSNSRRPEYGSITLDAQVTAELPADWIGTLYVVVSRKEYRGAIPFARLLPGEEANAASLAYLTLTRSLARNLDGAVRMGWSRAETETGGQYFQRFGAGILVNYRPAR